MDKAMTGDEKLEKPVNQKKMEEDDAHKQALEDHQQTLKDMKKEEKKNAKKAERKEDRKEARKEARKGQDPKPKKGDQVKTENSANGPAKDADKSKKPAGT